VLSPSGDTLVFVATLNGVSQLWRREVARDAAAAIPGTEGARWPVWVEVGRTLSFFIGGSLKRLDVASSTVEQVAALTGAAGAAWPGDGSVLLGHVRGPVDRLADGGTTHVTTLKAGDIGHRFPEVVDGQSWLYLAERSDGRRVVRLARGGTDFDVTDADGDARLVDDWLLYPRGGALLAQRFNRESGRVEGRAEALVTGVGVSATGRARVAASPRVLLFAPPGDRRRMVQWLNADGTPAEIASEPGDYWQVRTTPDGRNLAVTMNEPLVQTLDVYRLRVGSGAPEPVTLGLAADTHPVWSPDGGSLLFRSIRSGNAQLYTRRVGVTGAPEEPVSRDGAVVGGAPSDWLRGGMMLFTTPERAGANTDVMQVGAGAPAKLAATSFNESDARVSPDGQFVAYVSDESGQPEVYAARWPQGDRAKVSQAGGTHPRWAHGALYFLRDGREVYRATAQPGPNAVFAVPTRVTQLDDIRDFDVATGSGRLVVVAPARASIQSTIGALVDWPSMLSRP
jgi:hypothetical protein